VDAAGAPVAGVEVALDRTRKATTDAEGRFAFDAVEAGVRGLLLPGKRHLAVRVAPGESAEVEVGPGIPEVRVEIREDGKPVAGPLRGVLVGLDRLGSLHEVKAADGACTITGVLPGRFLLLTGSGALAVLELGGPVATIDLGGGTVSVQAPPGTSVSLAPAESDYLVDLLSMRVGSRPVDAQGRAPALGFPGLPDGDYRVLLQSPPGSGRKAGEARVEIRGGRDARVDRFPEK
jgi:hypothetical protein